MPTTFRWFASRLKKSGFTLTLESFRSYTKRGFLGGFLVFLGLLRLGLLRLGLLRLGFLRGLKGFVCFFEGFIL